MTAKTPSGNAPGPRKRKSTDSQQKNQEEVLKQRLKKLMSNTVMRMRENKVKVLNKRQYQINIGKRTMMLLQGKIPVRPVRMPKPKMHLNRFYISIFLMIGLIGGCSFYTYNKATKWYRNFNNFQVSEVVDWQGWLKKVSGPRKSFNKTSAKKNERKLTHRRVKSTKAAAKSRRVKARTQAQAKGQKRQSRSASTHVRRNPDVRSTHYQP